VVSMALFTFFKVSKPSLILSSVPRLVLKLSKSRKSLPLKA
jgi:hypothetical protein